jgi:hypothetical protein
VDGVVSYDELQAMTPQERHENFRESIIWRAEDVPDQYRPTLDRLQRRRDEREARLRGQAS